MVETKKLFENKWVEVHQKDFYVFAHHPWCKGKGVAVLPYRKTPLGELEFLGRFEIYHAHGTNIELCAITGGYDKEEETLADCAVREVREEGGYIVSSDSLIPLGTSLPSKASDSVMSLFAVEIKEDTPYETPTGDGTQAEEGSFAEWVSRKDLITSKDPNVATMLVRLEDKL